MYAVMTLVWLAQLVLCAARSGIHDCTSGQLSPQAAAPKFEVIGTGKLDDTFWSSPAVAGGDLYLRGVDHLYCVRQAKSK
jgi:hypothetical protein